MLEDRVDRLVNLDFGERGVEGLYEAARARAAGPLAMAAATRLAALPRGSTVLMTTGLAVRAAISPAIAENDGPAGAAVVGRALAEGLEAVPVVVAEASLLGAIGGIYQAAGMRLVSLDESRRPPMANARLSMAVMREHPIDNRESLSLASALLDELQPALCFSTERVGRNAAGVYHSARGYDLGAATAGIDHVFEEAARRGIPTIAVGDGGNEIGMGVITDAVRAHVRFGDTCKCGCGGGIGAVTGADVLVTAACSNWGCYAIVSCLAVLLGRPDLIHTVEEEERLLRRGVDLGLISSRQGRVDPDVDGIPLRVHLAVVELLGQLARVS